MYSCGIILIEYFGNSVKFDTIAELTKSAERIQNYKFKKAIINELEDCKKRKKNPYKMLLRLGKKLCNHECRAECPKDIIFKIIESCKRLEYDNVIRVAYKIPNKKISQIAVNLVQPKHRRRFNSRKLYFELYNEKLPIFNNNRANFDCNIDRYKEQFREHFKNSLQNLISNPNKRFLDKEYDEYKEIKKLFSNNKKKLYDLITNKTINKALSAYVQNIDFFDESDVERYLLLSVYVASCLFNRGIVGDYIITVILNNYGDENQFFKDMYNLINNKHFIIALYN